MSAVGLALALIGGIGGTYVARVVNDARQDQRLDVLEKRLDKDEAQIQANHDCCLKSRQKMRDDDDPPKRGKP